MTTNPHRTALRRLALIALLGALIFLWLLYRSATAQSAMLIRLYHDQDSSASVTAPDMPAVGVSVTVTEQCTSQVCAASPVAYVVFTDAAGYATLLLVDGVQYNIAAPCMAVTVQASEVSGQAVSEMVTCLQGVWLAVVGR